MYRGINPLLQIYIVPRNEEGYRAGVFIVVQTNSLVETREADHVGAEKAVPHVKGGQGGNQELGREISWIRVAAVGEKNL